MSKSEARRIAVQRNAKPAPLTMSAIERQLASVIHAARTAGPFGTSHRSEEEGLQNAKQKVLDLIRAALAEAERNVAEASRMTADAHIANAALSIRIAALEGALRAACELRNGRAYFRTANGMPMEMPKKSERIVRAALAEAEQRRLGDLAETIAEYEKLTAALAARVAALERFEAFVKDQAIYACGGEPNRDRLHCGECFTCRARAALAGEAP